MAYYDPNGWIDPADSLIGEVEDRLKLDKKAQPKGVSTLQRRARGTTKAFLPPVSLELDVAVQSTKELLRLTEWIDKAGKVYIDLTVSNDFLRKGHFNHDWHHNPDGRHIPPPHHIHFPTIKFNNLTRPHSYAYLVQSGSTYLEALQTFCKHVNINIKAVSLPLLRR